MNRSKKGCMSIIGFLCVFMFCLPVSLGAAETGADITEADFNAAETDAGTSEPETVQDALSALPFGFYTSDTGPAVGCMAVYERKDTESATALQLYGAATYTWEQQMELSASFNSSHAENGKDRTRLELGAGFFDTPSEFFGLGQVDDVQEPFTVRKLEGNAAYSVRAGRDLFTGLSVDFKRGTYTALEEGGQLEQLVGGEGHTEGAAGIGGKLMWDTRSDSLLPESGTFFMIQALLFPDVWSSGADFQRIECDGRIFMNPAEDLVLGFRGYGNFNLGDVPVLYQPGLGGLFMGRGYPYARFRENNLVILQSELRWQFCRRWGATVFIEGGEVADEPTAMSLEDLQPCYGLGLRFTVHPPSTVRIRLDVGFTPESVGIYLTLMEAF